MRLDLPVIFYANVQYTQSLLGVPFAEPEKIAHAHIDCILKLI